MKSMNSMESQSLDRRSFFKSSVAATAGLVLLPELGWSESLSAPENLNIIGPMEGYSPQLGTLVSMMNWMRNTVLRSVKKLTQAELDHLHDANSNTIGAMLLHLAATEVWYQANTFEGRSYNESEKAKWRMAMDLGEAARKEIRGNAIDHYLSLLQETREKTLNEFRKRDDKWLAEVDPSFFGRQPTNNYCKWFHVCEHESNHNGQIKWLLSRLPGKEKTKD